MDDGVYWVSGGEEASEQITTYQKLLDWRWVKNSETTQGNLTGISRHNTYIHNPYTGVLVLAQYGVGGSNEHTTSCMYTSDGNVQFEQTIGVGSIDYQYDATNTMVVRKEQVYDFGESYVDSMTVDAGLSVVINHWSPNGELTHNEYDGFGRPKASTIHPGTPAALGTIHPGYEADVRWTYHDDELPSRVVIETRKSGQAEADDYGTKVELYNLSGGLVQTATSATPDGSGQDRYATLRTISDYANRRTSVYGPFYASGTGLVGEAAIPDSLGL